MFLSGVNILPYNRILHPGTITDDLAFREELLFLGSSCRIFETWRIYFLLNLGQIFLQAFSFFFNFSEFFPCALKSLFHFQKFFPLLWGKIYYWQEAKAIILPQCSYSWVWITVSTKKFQKQLRSKLKAPKNGSFYKVNLGLLILTSNVYESCCSTKIANMAIESPERWLLDFIRTGFK